MREQSGDFFSILLAMMTMPSQFTPRRKRPFDGRSALSFLPKAQIMARCAVACGHPCTLKEEVGVRLRLRPRRISIPPTINFVKERISEFFPYQYLDFRNTFTTRTPLPSDPSFGGGTTSCAP